MLRKELREQLRTNRLLVVCAVFLFFGIQGPLLAKFTPQLIEAVAPEMQISVPTPTTADAIAQFLKSMLQMGPFAAILLAMGSVAREKERGTAALILSKPAGRPAFLLAKFAALAGLLAAGILLAGLVAYIYTVILFDSPSPAGFAVMCLLVLLQLLVYGAVTFLGSTLVNSALPAAGIGIAAFIGFAIISVIPNVASFAPPALNDPGTAFALGRPVSNLLPPLLVSLALLAGTLLLAVFSFRKQEL